MPTETIDPNIHFDSVNNLVQYALLHRIPRADFASILNAMTYSLNDLNKGLDTIFRTRWITRDQERAAYFHELYSAILAKSQVPEFADPFNGMVRKKIKDLKEFTSQYSKSIYTFVQYL
jgi:hypothetical protein